jgi:hypothetical protein
MFISSAAFEGLGAVCTNTAALWIVKSYNSGQRDVSEEHIAFNPYVHNRGHRFRCGYHQAIWLADSRAKIEQETNQIEQ